MPKLVLLLSFVFLIGCSDDSEGLTFEQFEAELALRFCDGLYSAKTPNPGLKRFSKFADAEACKESIDAIDLDRNWYKYDTGVAAGTLKFDGVAAERCLNAVADGLSEGYGNWYYIPGCSGALSGLIKRGAECESIRALCEPDLICGMWNGNAQTCDFGDGCTDTHDCESGEVCSSACFPATAPKAEGDDCAVFSGDDPPDICTPGLACVTEELTGSEFKLYGKCNPPVAEGESCRASSDCAYGLKCLPNDCTGACPDALCTAD